MELLHKNNKEERRNCLMSFCKEECWRKYRRLERKIELINKPISESTHREVEWLRGEL